MKDGVNYMEMEVVDGDKGAGNPCHVYLGVARPNIVLETVAYSTQDVWVVRGDDGRRIHGQYSDYPGQATYGKGDTIGLLLDQRNCVSLTYFKNGVRMGIA